MLFGHMNVYVSAIGGLCFGGSRVKMIQIDKASFFLGTDDGEYVWLWREDAESVVMLVVVVVAMSTSLMNLINITSELTPLIPCFRNLYYLLILSDLLVYYLKIIKVSIRRTHYYMDGQKSATFRERIGQVHGLQKHYIATTSFWWKRKKKKLRT
ncbi:hypothetical protein ACJX0J_011451, partial [Zea mays]